MYPDNEHNNYTRFIATPSWKEIILVIGRLTGGRQIKKKKNTKKTHILSVGSAGDVKPCIIIRRKKLDVKMLIETSVLLASETCQCYSCRLLECGRQGFIAEIKRNFDGLF